MEASDSLTIGSLCSGIGGLDLGAQAALGGRVVWHADTDPRAVQVLSRHWPGVPNHGDIREINWQRVEPVCVLTAGFPCQDLSVVGTRTGLVPGTRSGLWHHIVTAVGTLRLHLVVIENVRGILSTRAGIPPLRDVEPCPKCLGDRADHPRLRALGVLLADLADLGYDACWTCVRASDVGAPHRRERVFLTAWPATPSPADPVEDDDGEPRQQRRLPAPGQTQSGRTRPHPGRRDRAPAPHPESQRRRQGLTEPALPQRRPHPCLHRSGPHPAGHVCGRGGQTASAYPDLGRRQGRRGHDAEASRRHESADRRHSPALWWGDYLPAIRRWEDATGRPAPPPTVPGTRRLSAEFVEWMMGLPSGWVTAIEGLTRAAQLHLLGNSVVPQQAALALDLLLTDSCPPRCSLQPGGRSMEGA
ncbi:DNA cytosine methyltransferase [Streptomyces sp. ISL-100]|nr:DNA cytosine methyltransferase [Streptomyces sp. ISL-100]